MACDLTSKIEQRDAIEESIASGVLSITVDGQSTTFASIADRQRVLNRLNAEIAEASGAGNLRPVASTIYMGGFGP